MLSALLGILLASAAIAAQFEFSNLYQYNTHRLAKGTLYQPSSVHIDLQDTTGADGVRLSLPVPRYKPRKGQNTSAIRAQVKGRGFFAVIEKKAGDVLIPAVTETTEPVHHYSVEVRNGDFVLAVIDPNGVIQKEEIAGYFRRLTSHKLDGALTKFLLDFNEHPISIVVGQVLKSKDAEKSFKTISFPDGADTAVISETSNFRRIKRRRERNYDAPRHRRVVYDDDYDYPVRSTRNRGRFVNDDYENDLFDDIPQRTRRRNAYVVNEQDLPRNAAQEDQDTLYDDQQSQSTRQSDVDSRCDPTDSICPLGHGRNNAQRK